MLKLIAECFVIPLVIGGTIGWLAAAIHGRWDRRKANRELDEWAAIRSAIELLDKNHYIVIDPQDAEDTPE